MQISETDYRLIVTTLRLAIIRTEMCHPYLTLINVLVVANLRNWMS